MAEHEADEVVFAVGIATPVLYLRQSGVVVQQQIVLEKEKPTMTKERSKRNQTREQMVMEWQLKISRDGRRNPAVRPPIQLI